MVYFPLKLHRTAANSLIVSTKLVGKMARDGLEKTNSGHLTQLESDLAETKKRLATLETAIAQFQAGNSELGVNPSHREPQSKGNNKGSSKDVNSLSSGSSHRSGRAPSIKSRRSSLSSLADARNPVGETAPSGRRGSARPVSRRTSALLVAVPTSRTTMSTRASEGEDEEE